MSVERHFTIVEIAQFWGLSKDTVRAVFQNRPDVLRIGRPSSTKNKRHYVSLRVPESVVIKAHQQLCAHGTQGRA